MIVNSTDALREKGISCIHADLSLDIFKLDTNVLMLLLMNGHTPDTALPFSITLYASDRSGRAGDTLGFVQATLHRELSTLSLDASFQDCSKLIFINMLFTEPAYRGCGIASALLEALPGLVSTELGDTVDGILLAPVPQYRNEDGEIVQVPMRSIEYLAKSLQLMSFYSARGFVFSHNPMIMGKRLHPQN